MTESQLLDFIYTWVDKYTNLVNDQNLIGSCSYTAQNTKISGTGFNGKISNDGWVKSDKDSIWVPILSYTDTEITLKYPYPGTTHSEDSFYLANIIPIIFAKQNAPLPEGKVIVIQRPFGITSVGGNVNDRTDNNGLLKYTTRYQATITIDILNSTGEELMNLVDRLNQQDVRDLFWKNNVSILHNNGLNQVDFQNGEEWIDRMSIDFIIMYTNECSYSPGYIGTVDFTGTYKP